MLKVHLDNDQSDLALDEAQVAPLVEAVLSLEGVSPEEVSVSFAGEAAMCAMHEEFFLDPSLTDCMSFPIDGQILGDVVLCPKVAIGYVRDHGGDPYEELSLYLVHGLLHLLGYDDMEEEKRGEMRAAEKRVMAHLKEQGLILACPT